MHAPLNDHAVHARASGLAPLIATASHDLATRAFASFSARALFSDRDLAELAEACATVPKEEIRVGDVGEQNQLDVGRFMEDRMNETPVFRHPPLGPRVVEILSGERASEFFAGIMQEPFYIRRCQVNVLIKDSFIGKHIDLYSNMDYKYSVVIQFGQDYDGGEFFVEQDGVEQEIKTGYADLLVNRCEIPHGVRHVRGGNRTSLVFFLGRQPLSERNVANKQIAELLPSRDAA